MTQRQLSARAQSALRAISNGTHRHPIMPATWILRRDAADHLCDLGLAKFRMFDPKLGHGGYYITAAGRKVIAHGEQETEVK
jgi:hypothetical protein